MTPLQGGHTALLPRLRASLAHYCSLQAPGPASPTCIKSPQYFFGSSTEGASLATVHKTKPSAHLEVHPWASRGPLTSPGRASHSLHLHPGAHRRHSPGTDTQGISLTLLSACKAEPHVGPGAASQNLAVFLLPLEPISRCACQGGPPSSIQGLCGPQRGTADGEPPGVKVLWPLGESWAAEAAAEARAPVGVSSPLLRVPGPLPSLDSWSCPLPVNPVPCLFSPSLAHF